jgi:hypothetical protein
MTASVSAAPTAAQDLSDAKTPLVELKKTEEAEAERPPQEEELLCTICHMPSCWQ